MSDLFESAGLESGAPPRPLADRLRPRSLGDVVGQDHLVRGDGPIAAMAASGRVRSAVLWGPPGCGKTTIGRLLAACGELAFVQLSAVDEGVAALRRAFAEAAARRREGRGTLLFVDEIHRFNRAQQDALLPPVEDGTVTLIGATTENPSFEVNAALLSRCRVLVLRRLGRDALAALLRRAEEASGGPLRLSAEAREALLAMADGDGRMLVNLAEDLADDPPGEELDRDALARRVRSRAALYDRKGDGHYGLISALHKSVRGSDPDAALYWLARMLDAGEDPRYLGRRLIRMAAEDIGLADPGALGHAVAAFEAYRALGTPEGELALAQAVVQLATAPKSNAVHRAFGAALRAARGTGSLAPPPHILNAPTRLMKELGHGRDYAYDHDEPGAFSGQDYFPEGMAREAFYRPTDRGAEARIARRLEEWRRLRAARAGGGRG